jgi:hypothetical protein
VRLSWVAIGSALFGLATSCAFLLDFDELQADGADAAAGGSSASGGTAGASTGGSSGSGTGGTGGTSGAAGTGGLPDQIPLSGLAEAITATSCQLFSNCYGPAVEVVSQGTPCDQYFLPFLEDSVLAPIMESVTAGAITYDPAAGAACVQGIYDAATADPPACANFDKLVESCKSAFGGLSQANQPCDHRFECAEGMYCDLAGCPAATCKALGAVGSTCVANAACNPVADLYCKIPSGQTTGTCAKYIATAATCAAGDTCEPGAYCLEGVCARIAKLFTLDAPQTCYTNSLLCNAGLACEFTGLPFLSPGKCLAAKVPAQACHIALPEECPTGHYCTSSVFNGPGTCQILPANGETCAKAGVQTIGLRGPCQPGLACVNDECAPYAKLTQPCEGHAQCFSGACVGNVCVPPSCPD